MKKKPSEVSGPRRDRRADFTFAVEGTEIQLSTLRRILAETADFPDHARVDFVIRGGYMYPTSLHGLVVIEDL